MKVHHTLICLFLSLQDGNTGLTDAQQLYTRTEGGHITVTCSFFLHGDTKYFCRNKCEGDDKLIETKEDSSQRDRYRIKYDRRGWTENAVLYVSITHLNKSDSGRYRCGLDGSFPFSDRYEDFELRVTDAPAPPGPNLTPAPPGPNLTPTPPGPKLTPSPLSTSLSPAASPQSVGSSAPSSTSVPSPLHAGPETVYTGVMKENIEYEEIREDRRSRPPPVEVNTLYTTATHTTPTPAEASDVYSVPTVPAAVAPDSAEDVSYADVNVVASLHKTSADRTDVSVIYSVPAVAGQRSSLHHDAPDLYS
ncbi:hypothetical protein INR49_031875, partial [Caranx melampygus]